MSPDTYQTIFERFHLRDSAPCTELVFTSPFELLVAVILSARATDRGVNLATPALFAAAPTPADMLKLGVEGLSGYIKTIGLYRSKALHIIQTCQKLLSEHQGEVPSTREALERLPGVGRKTANVLLNTLFHQPTIAVDTHIFRVANRTGLAKGKTVTAVEGALLKCVPEAFLLNCHHWLVLHGRYVCKARQPLCSQCFIHDLCEYPFKSPKEPPPSVPGD